MFEFFKQNMDEGRHEMNNWLSGPGKKVVLVGGGLVALGILYAMVFG